MSRSGSPMNLLNRPPSLPAAPEECTAPEDREREREREREQGANVSSVKR